MSASSFGVETVVCVRHGQTRANALDERLDVDLSGCREEVLNELTAPGRQQMASVRVWLIQGGFAEFGAYRVSSHPRTRESALVINPEAPWQEDSGFDERNWGDLAFLTRGQRIKRYGEAFSKRSDNPYRWTPPGNGERIHAVDSRVRTSLGDLLRLEARSCCLVAHGGSISLIRKNMMGWTVDEYNAQYNARDYTKGMPGDWIPNGGILIFTRRDPHSLRLVEEFSEGWIRQVWPYRDLDSGWQSASQNQDTRGECQNGILSGRQVVA